MLRKASRPGDTLYMLEGYCELRRYEDQKSTSTCPPTIKLIQCFQFKRQIKQFLNFRWFNSRFEPFTHLEAI